MDCSEILRFGAIRRIILMFKYALNLFEDIKAEHDQNLDNIKKSLIDYEIFIKEKYNIDVELQHLANHVDYLNDYKFNSIRKQILDYGNNLKREMEQE